MQSIAVLTVETAGGSKVSGLAFVSSGENRAVTALHLLKDARKVTLKFQNGGEVDSPGFVDLDEKRGIALLDLPAPGKAALRLAPVKISPGTTVNCAAVRDAAFGFVQLSVSEVHQGADGVERYILSGEASGGNSGGPALDPKGSVIGLVLEEKKDGNIQRTLVPAAFILALKASEPIKAWGAQNQAPTAQKPGTSAPGPKDEIDSTLLDFFVLLSDHKVTYYWADEVTRSTGLQQGVPQQMYDHQTKLSLGLRQIKALTTDDPLRKDLLKTFVEIGTNQFSAAEFMVNAVVAWQQANNWGPQSQDLQKRAGASMTLANELNNASIPALRELYEKSSVFKEKIPKELVYSMGIEKRPSIFSLGVQTYARNPFALVMVYPDSVASTLGLQTGDLIVSAAGTKFESNGSIEDFKVIIQNNLGNAIDVLVERSGKKTDLKMAVLKEIPANFLY
ncbi:MAG: trypsin-like peptidase domain-containing protein [Thermovirgaceae bacterium]|nr:trypsin-like peptidase domain-containing protein [Thermovirgaceae bacterium]